MASALWHRHYGLGEVRPDQVNQHATWPGFGDRPASMLSVMRSSQVLAQAEPGMWEGYGSAGCWDELLVDGQPRHACDGVLRYLVSLGPGWRHDRRRPNWPSGRWGSPSPFTATPSISTSLGLSTWSPG